MIRVKGHATFVLIDEVGKIKQIVESDNLVVSAGLCFIAQSLIDSSGSYVMSGMGVGTGATAAANGDLNLETSAAYVELSGAVRSNATLTYIAQFDPGEGTGTLTEAVICCAASAWGDKPVGAILCRTTYSPIAKGGADTLQVTWTLAFSDI